MKRNHYLLLFFMFVLLSGCKDNQYATTPAILSATAVSPADGTRFDLVEDGIYEFSWTGTGSQPQVVIFAPDPQMSSKYYVTAGDTGVLKLSTQTLSNIATNFKAIVGEPFSLYWAVVPAANPRIEPREVRELTVVVSLMETIFEPSDKEFDLEDPDNATVTFSWKKETLASGAKPALVFRLDPNAEEEAVMELSENSGSQDLTDIQLQEVFSRLNVRPGAVSDLYWNIRDLSTSSEISLVWKKISATTKTSVFVDIRGDEVIVYETVKVDYLDGTSQIWMAESLRTTKLPDGTDLTSDEYQDMGYSGDYARFAGYQYYVGNNFFYQKVVPTRYWRLPTSEEMKKLIDAASASPYGVSALISDLNAGGSWVDFTPVTENLNAWGFNMVSSGCIDANWSEKGNQYFNKGFGMYCSDSPEWMTHYFTGKSIWTVWTQGSAIRLVLDEE